MEVTRSELKDYSLGNPLLVIGPIPKDDFIGSLLKGVLWESTAVSELRIQASTVAKNLIEKIQDL
jgi:hypothetical protein